MHSSTNIYRAQCYASNVSPTAKRSMSKSVRYSVRGSLAENTSAKKSGAGGLPLNGSKSPFATFWWRVDRRLIRAETAPRCHEARPAHLPTCDVRGRDLQRCTEYRPRPPVAQRRHDSADGSQQRAARRPRFRALRCPNTLRRRLDCANSGRSLGPAVPTSKSLNDQAAIIALPALPRR
jgi:hypothetical protein